MENKADAAGCEPAVKRDEYGKIHAVRPEVALTGAGAAELRAALAERFPAPRAGQRTRDAPSALPIPYISDPRAPRGKRPPCPSTTRNGVSAAALGHPISTRSGATSTAASTLFGRKQPADSGDDAAPPKRPLPLGGAGLLAALVLVVWLGSGSYIVDEGRRGVVTRFGKYTETTTPGLRWHLPFPIEAAEVVDFSQVKTVEVGYRNSNPKNKIAKESLMLTDDENIIDLQFAVQYNLKSAPDYVFNTRKPDDIVFQVAATAMSEVVGRSQMDFVLYEGRAQIAPRPEKLMQAMLDRYGTGVSIQKVTLQNTQPPEQVQAAFDDAVSQPDRERQKNEGQAYSNDVVPGRAAWRRDCCRRPTATPPASCKSRRRREPVQADSRRVRQGAGGHARTAVSRHDAIRARQLEQGADRPEGR